eukprot:TRINITY_DN1515_c0_g1_i4.p1 TRINITY_DN1515_c0_g1~~TRINITY_DN1515_c0_g1_i4.p1  ORF type:complete len:173 (-),score=44.21 TRINITY_DN1515_c0_g1_i4:252-770(-)
MTYLFFFFFQAEDGIRDLVRSRGLGDVYKRQVPLLVLPAGMIASLCGMGGGVVIGPVLLELGARTQSIPATASFIMLVTASSSTLQFVLIGKLPLFYALMMGAMGAFGSLLGVGLLDCIVSRTKRANLFIIVVITGILVVSAALMGYSGIRNVVRMSNIEGSNFGLRNLCLN